MMLKVLRQADITALAAGVPVQVWDGKPTDKAMWAVAYNLTSWIFELIDDQGSVRDVVMPGRSPVPLRVVTTKLFLNPVAQLSGVAAPLAASSQAVYLDVTDTKPENIDLMPLASGSAALPTNVRLQDGASTQLATVNAFGQVRVQQIDSAGNSLAPFQNIGDLQPFTGPLQVVMSVGEVFNGAQWDRSRSASAANLIAQSGLGAALVAPPGQWSAIAAPATGSTATVSRAAGGAGIRHIYMGASITASASGAAPVAGVLQAFVRDGVSGAGTSIDGSVIGIEAVAGWSASPFLTSQKSIPGSLNSAMTAELNAAIANVTQIASVSGYDAS